MGFLDMLEGDRIYLDRNTQIYGLERCSEFCPELTLPFEQI